MEIKTSVITTISANARITCSGIHLAISCSETVLFFFSLITMWNWQPDVVFSEA